MERRKQSLNIQFLRFSVCLLSFLTFECDSISVKSRIIEGRSTSITSFPWQVIIKKSKNQNLRGGGSIISPNWVLTAAHCTFGLKKVYLKMGANFLWSRIDVEMTSKDIYIHPEYDDLNLQNDISLIKLPMSLEISDTVRPVPLVPYEYKNEDFVGMTGIITGYGYIDDDYANPFSDLLRTEVTIISNDECEESYEDRVYESTMCSVGADGSIQSFCDGDSGGPLVLRDWDGRYFQVGIISYSAKLSCSKNYPAAYTRLTSYLDFIAETTQLSLK